MEHCLLYLAWGCYSFSHIVRLMSWNWKHSFYHMSSGQPSEKRNSSCQLSCSSKICSLLNTHTHTVYIFWFCYTLCVLLFAHTCTHTPVMCCLCTRKPIHIGTHACWNAFVMEPSTCRKLQEYQTAYQSLKGLRTLEWKPHLGTVDVDLVLADRELSFSVSPIRATIIYQFQQQSEPCLFDIHWI